MKKLNTNCVYSLEDLTSEEFKVLNKYLTNNKEARWTSMTFTDLKNESLYILYWRNYGGWYLDNVTHTQTINAKELFYTLENIQVDCRELSEEQIKEMADVFEKAGYDNSKIGLEVKDIYFLLRQRWDKDDRNFGVLGDHKDDRFNTITYSKFMELFGDQVADVGEMVKTFKVTEYSTGDFMDLGREVGVITAKNKDHAWELYKETHRLKDSEKGFYSFTESASEELTEEAYKEIEYEVKYISEKPKHYSKGIDTFARMEANCTKEECLAFAKGNIDKYNFRTKGQDLEDYKKIVSYANWAIKLLKDEAKS